MADNPYEKLNDPNLFLDNKPGEYSYYSNDLGKGASGVLALTDTPVRDNKAQREAGGEFRRDADNQWGADEGGHIIAARFGGSASEENLVAQSRNFNRGEYKSLENHWTKEINNGNKVYVHMDFDDGERPNTCLGYAIIEYPSGAREIETYSLYNESAAERASWEKDADEFEDYLGTAENGADDDCHTEETCNEECNEEDCDYEF